MSDAKKLAHSKKSAGAILDVGPTKLNELIASGVLRTVLIGGCVRIPDEELVRLAQEGDGRPLTDAHCGAVLMFARPLAQASRRDGSREPSAPPPRKSALTKPPDKRTPPVTRERCRITGEFYGRPIAAGARLYRFSPAKSNPSRIVSPRPALTKTRESVT